jgi:deazaflavin-dependent oxidoreductase (nitroreductase family)
MYQADGDRWVIIASNGGSGRHPAWWFNLQASPDATVEVGRETYPVTVAEATGDERDVLWRRMADMYPGYDGYAQKTDRKIPVAVLQRR